MKRLGIVLISLCLLLPARPAEALKKRDVLMFGSGLVNLFFLTLVSWKSMTNDPHFREEGSEFVPNYNFSPDSPEAILATKISDRLVTFPLSRGIRTLPRSYYRDFLVRVDDCEAELAPDSFAREALSHLQNEEDRLRERWGRPYLEAKADASYLFASSPNRVVPAVTGGVNPLLTLKEGIFSEDGHDAWIGSAFRGGVTSWLSYEFAPRALLSSNDAGTQEHAAFYLHRGYLKGNLRNFEIELGKDTVQWGFGHQGTMLFSGNAEPFYLFRLANSRPVELPWFLHHLGPTRVDFFFTFLDENREFPHSILHGMMTTFQPHRRWEIGVGQSVQFGGEGSDSWNPANYFGEALTGDRNANRNFVVQSRWRIPRLEVEPYLELFWEDCCRDGFEIVNPRDMLNLAGIYFPNLGAGGRVDFAAEWVRTNPITYRHGIYTSGFFFKGHGMGHPIGPDGTGVYGILRYFHSPTFWGKMVTAFEQRGRLGEVSPENRYRLVFNVNHEISRRLRIGWEGGYERVSRFGFQQNVNRDNVIAGFSLELF